MRMCKEVMIQDCIFILINNYLRKWIVIILSYYKTKSLSPASKIPRQNPKVFCYEPLVF